MYKFLIVTIILAAACNAQSPIKQNKVPEAKSSEKSIEYKISLKINDKVDYKVGDRIEIDFKTNAKTNPDSVKLIVNNSNVKMAQQMPLIWDSEGAKTGSQKINVVFYWGDSIKQTLTKQIVLKSDVEPKKYTYKVIQSWPHNAEAYTQGLEFDNGFLYEGTGQYGESMLTKIKLETNEVVQSINLSKEVFGEGITIMDDKIYQLTWKSSIGYVYDKESFNELYTFSYPTDGWGLTNNGKELIMSDGSETIYFLDNEYFNEIRRIQVFDNNGPVHNLNELEFIDGEIYANIYGSKQIVVFDSKTGKVLKHIDLNGILKGVEVNSQIDVLNGIAWESKNNRLVVTGKWWPKLFQIELIEK